MYRGARVTSSGKRDEMSESCYQQLRESLLAQLSDSLKRGLQIATYCRGRGRRAAVPERASASRNELDVDPLPGTQAGRRVTAQPRGPAATVR